MTKEEEIRMINEKLDFYVMEASDEEFDTEEVRKLVKRLDELDPIPLPWKSDEEVCVLEKLCGKIYIREVCKSGVIKLIGKYTGDKE